MRKLEQARKVLREIDREIDVLLGNDNPDHEDTSDYASDQAQPEQVDISDGSDQGWG
jgi:hypothetical protein